MRTCGRCRHTRCQPACWPPHAPLQGATLSLLLTDATPLIPSPPCSAIEPRQLYTSSPTADRAARQGLGGTQGLAVLAGALGIVALVTLVGAAQPPDTLQVRLAPTDRTTLCECPWG